MEILSFMVFFNLKLAKIMQALSEDFVFLFFDEREGCLFCEGFFCGPTTNLGAHTSAKVYCHQATISIVDMFSTSWHIYNILPIMVCFGMTGYLV